MVWSYATPSAAEPRLDVGTDLFRRDFLEALTKALDAVNFVVSRRNQKLEQLFIDAFVVH